MPVYVHVVKNGKVLYTDRLSTIYFKKHYEDFIKFIEEEFNLRYPTLELLFKYDKDLPPKDILEEALDLLTLLNNNKDILPKAYVFAILPKDFWDVPSLLIGGCASMKVFDGNDVYELISGFGYAKVLKNGVVIKILKSGDEVAVGNRKVKVFSRNSYDVLERSLKTLITMALIALRSNAKIRTKSSSYLAIINDLLR